MSTTTPNRTDPMSRLYRTRWFMPAFSLFLGALMFVAFWVGGNPADGAFAAGVMAFVAALFYFGGRRSETLAGLGGPARDERWERIDVHATALAGDRPRHSSSSAPGSSRSPRAGTAARTRSSAPSAASPTSLAVAFLRWRS